MTNIYFVAVVAVVNATQNLTLICCCELPAKWGERAA